MEGTFFLAGVSTWFWPSCVTRFTTSLSPARFRVLGLCLLVAALSTVACTTENHSKREETRAASLASAKVPGSSSGTSVQVGESPESDPLFAGRAAGPVLEVSGEELVKMIPQQGGRGALVNIWATWCGPCREELPMLLAESKRRAPRGLELLLVSVDERENEAKVAKTLSELGLLPPYYMARRPLGEFKRALHPVWPGNVPVSFLFDRSGRRLYFWGGPVEREEVAPILDGFLAGKKIDGEARFQLAPGKTLD